MPKNLLLSTLDKRAGSIGCYYLPKGLLKLDIQWSTDENGNRALAFSADVTLVPDPAFRYYLNYTPSWLSSDEINVTYTEEGFLSNITTTQTDETLNVVSTVIQSIGSVLTGTPMGGVGTRDLGERAGEPESPIIFKGYIDPLDTTKVELLNQVLAKHKLFFVVSPVSGDIASVEKLSVESSGAGVFYRPFETYQVAIGSMDARVGMSEEYLISLPSATSVHLAKIPMAPFVSNTFNMSFRFGVPQTVVINKPSSALAAVKVPFDILQAIIALPSQLFQFRINLLRDKEINTTAYSEALLGSKQAEKRLADLEKRIAQGRPLTGGTVTPVAAPVASPQMPVVSSNPVSPVAVPPATGLPPSTYTPPLNSSPLSAEAMDASANSEEMPPTMNF